MSELFVDFSTTLSSCFSFRAYIIIRPTFSCVAEPMCRDNMFPFNPFGSTVRGFSRGISTRLGNRFFGIGVKGTTTIKCSRLQIPSLVYLLEFLLCRRERPIDNWNWVMFNSLQNTTVSGDYSITCGNHRASQESRNHISQYKFI